MPPTLSIGLPCFNAGPFLSQAVQSILVQTFRDWELIVLDDGSRDGSLSTLTKFADPRIRIYSDGLHRGLGARLNEIVKLSRGKYVARMDADDLSHPRRFEMQVQFLEEHPEVDGVGCGLISFDRDHRAIGKRIFPCDMDGIVADPLRGILIAHATFCARKAWVERHSYNESNLGCEDWELWQSSYRNSRFANLAEPLYFYREFDSFSLSKYLRSKLTATRLLWSQRREHGFRKTGHRCATNLAAATAYLFAGGMGVTEKLIARRSQPIDQDERREFTTALEFIRKRRM
jgi:glycosyltransferase involved in cell wall biosynthesis